MLTPLIKKSISLALAFAVVLSLSCCGVGDEVLIDEITSEPTTAATETVTEETTKGTTTTAATTEATTTSEITTEETTQTTPEETTTFEATTSETTTEKATETTTAATTETTTEVTTTTEETTGTTSELDAAIQNMPEIVFVYSFCEEIYEDVFGRNENIFGYYVTNTGEIKIFDFRPIAPDELYDISEVYDRLEEATCDGLYLRNHGEIAGIKRISENDITPLSQDEVIDCYERLLLVEGDAEFFQDVPSPDWSGLYIIYGIRNNDKGEKECIILEGQGCREAIEYKNNDHNADYITNCLYTNKHFPYLYGQSWSVWPD